MKQLSRILFFTVLMVSLFACRRPDNPPGPDGPDVPDGPGPDNPSEAVYTATPSSATFNSNGGTIQIVITSTDDRSFVTGTEDSWIKIISAEDGILIISVANNGDTSPRSGQVVVYDSSGGKLIIPVSQEGKPASTEDGFTAVFTLNDNVSIAPKEFANHICAIDPDYIYLDKDTPRELIPPIPSYIVVNTPTDVLPDGLMASLQGLEQQGDGSYKILYMKIGITSAFKDLNFNIESLDLDAYVEKIVDAEGNEVKFVKTRAAETHNYKIEVPSVAWPIGGGFELTPKIEADICLKLQFIVDGYRVSTFNAKVITDLVLGAEVSLTTAEVGVDFNLKLLSIYFAAVPAGPLVLTPAIDIYAVAGASGKISLVASTACRMTMTSAIHYDEQSGASGSHECTEPENVEEERTFGPKVEGAFQYGLGIGPKIGVYGSVISAGFSIDAMLEESISKTFSLDEFQADWDQDYFSSLLMDTDYNYAFATAATLHLEGLGFPWSISTPDIKFPISQRRLVPTLEDFELEVIGDELTVKAMLKNPAILYPQFKMVLSNIINGQEADKVDTFFDIDQSDIKELEEKGEPVQVSASFTIPEGVLYSMGPRVYMDVLNDGNWLKVTTLPGPVVAVDPACREAFVGILQDIYECRGGEWPGCNWFEEGLPLSKYSNVSISPLDPGEFRYIVTIPNDWPLGSALTIANHTEGMKKFGEWSLIIENREMEMEKMELSDDRLVNLRPCNKVKEFRFHGLAQHGNTTGAGNYINFPDEVETLDLSRSWITGFTWGDNLTCSPQKIILDNCPNLVSIYMSAASKDKFPQLSAKGCSKLGTVYVKEICIDGLDLSGIVPVDDCGLYISWADLKRQQSFSVNNLNFTLLSLTACKIPQLSVSAMPKLQRISVIPPANEQDYTISVSDCPVLSELEVKRFDDSYQLSSLSVAYCHSLRHLTCYGLNMSSFELTGVPALQTLDCRGNQMTGEMLPVFDQMFDAGYEPLYEVRYRYDDEGEVIEDKGYGYYYSDEPQRGYHRHGYH